MPRRPSAAAADKSASHPRRRSDVLPPKMERRFRKLVFEPMDLIRMALEIPGTAYECLKGLQPGMQFVDTSPRLEEGRRFITFLLYCEDWPIVPRGQPIPQLELVFHQHHNIVVEEPEEEPPPHNPFDDFVVASA